MCLFAVIFVRKPLKKIHGEAEDGHEAGFQRKFWIDLWAFRGGHGTSAIPWVRRVQRFHPLPKAARSPIFLCNVPFLGKKDTTKRPIIIYPLFISHSHGKWSIEIDGLPIQNDRFFHGSLSIMFVW